MLLAEMRKVQILKGEVSAGKVRARKVLLFPINLGMSRKREYGINRIDAL